MSLFSMFKNHSKINDNLIKDTISGNLCRCTGYQPIIKAAKSLNKKNKNDQFTKNKNNLIKLLKKIKNEIIIIYRDGKKYFAPRYVQELKKILKKNINAHLLSGGTDLSLVVTKERKDIDCIIVATTTPDDTFPSTATKIQNHFKMNNIPAFDIQAVCSGFIYSLQVHFFFLHYLVHL